MADANTRTQGAAEETPGAAATVTHPSGETMRETSERANAPVRPGTRQASSVTKTAAETATQTGASLAESMQELTRAWTHYAEEVMRQTTEASRDMIGCRSLSDMLEIQTKLWRGNLEAFLDESSKIAEIASRMATRPLEALRQASEVRATR